MNKSAEDNLLGNNNPANIDSNIDINTKTKLHLGKNMTYGNFLEENSGINIKNLFPQV